MEASDRPVPIAERREPVEADDDAVNEESTTESNPSSHWQVPANTLAVAISRALFLAEPPVRRADNYFSVFPPGLKNAAAPLCRLVDTGGARPPVAILDAALSLPEARAEEHLVALALSAPSMLSSTSEKARAPSLRSAPVSVRQLTPPSTGAPDTRHPNTPKQKLTDRPPSAVARNRRRASTTPCCPTKRARPNRHPTAAVVAIARRNRCRRFAPRGMGQFADCGLHYTS